MGNYTPILSIPSGYAAKLRKRIREQSETRDSGCIEWTGSMDRRGYGKTTVSTGEAIRCTGAHRAAWLAFKGDIPEGLQIDHLCRNTGCVNTAHMELVTGQENIRRADHSNKGPKRIGPVCEIHGDTEVAEYSGGASRNTYRVCRACKRDYMREYMRTYKK